MIYSSNRRRDFFYLPGDVHDISSVECPFEYCWLTFDGEWVNHLIRSFDITRAIRHVGPCPISIFESLDLNMHDYTPRGEYLSGADGYRILALAFSGKNADNSLAERFRALVRENISNPKLDCLFGLNFSESTAPRFHAMFV